jgi:hypothetical protein
MICKISFKSNKPTAEKRTPNTEDIFIDEAIISFSLLKSCSPQA